MKNYRKKAESENELTEDYQTESYDIRKKKKHKKKIEKEIKNTQSFRRRRRSKCLEKQFFN